MVVSMDISFLGLSCVRLKGRKTTLIIDPFTKESSGISFPKTEADAILFTAKQSPITITSQVSGYRVVIDGPGDYEVGGVAILGVKVADVTTYSIKIDGLSILHLGALSENLTDSDLDKYPNIDILLVPMRKDATSLVAKLEPKIVIPVLFNSETLIPFLAELGKESSKSQPKLSITRERLPSELEVVVLE